MLVLHGGRVEMFGPRDQVMARVVVQQPQPQPTAIPQAEAAR
jgi:ABC-type protease/lipase transport system fused ATPase/permease subunit